MEPESDEIMYHTLPERIQLTSGDALIGGELNGHTEAVAQIVQRPTFTCGPINREIGLVAAGFDEGRIGNTHYICGIGVLQTVCSVAGIHVLNGAAASAIVLLPLSLQKSNMKDYVKSLQSVDNDKILIKNKEDLNRKLEKFIRGGFEHLAVISDFDKTITKQHVDGKPQPHAFGVLQKCPSVPPNISKIITELTEKYRPLDKDLSISETKRNELMEEWWIKTIEAYRGLIISHQELVDSALKYGPPPRDNAKLFFDKLVEANVPVLLLSAGIGELLEPLLDEMNITSPNVELLTNYIKLDSEGKIVGYQQHHPIHTVNKNKVSFNGTKFLNASTNRHNILVLGDHLNDSTVADTLPNVENSLKIGFYYGEAESVLPVWLDTFDIVLKDDQSMDVPIAILKLLQ